MRTGTSTPTTTTSNSYTNSIRPLIIEFKNIRISIPTSSSLIDFTASEISRETFYDYLKELELNSELIKLNEELEINEDSNQNLIEEDLKEKSLILISYFLNHLVLNLINNLNFESTKEVLNLVLLSSFLNFNKQFLNLTDIHNLTFKYSNQVRNLIISSYYQAKSTLELNSNLAKSLPNSPQSKLLGESLNGNAEIYGLFGGQGMNEVYFDELQSLYDLYSPLLLPFLSTASIHLATLASAESSSLLFEHSLNALSWLQDPSKRPSVAYLASCAISLPLIGFTQLAQYIVYGKGLNLGPSELGSRFKGVTGHSQGVVSACVIARKYPAQVEGSTEDSWEPFYQQACKGLSILFQIGYQGSLAFPPLAIPPALTASALENGEGIPTPMLAVTGLDLASLEKKIKEGNAIVVGDGREATVAVSLFNGSKAFVVTGSPKDLVGLSDRLRKGRAPAGKDQSKIPHSKRLPVFSMRFLPVGVPYHSHLLDGCTAKALASLPAEDASFWEPSSLAITVYHTEDGSDIRNMQTPSFITSLFDQVFSSPIHWYGKATQFPPTATHAIDFGTGGASGIGSLCVRNWEGRGIRTILLGNRGEGAGAGREAWSSQNFEKDERWEVKFRPRLVKTSDGKIHIDTPFSRLLSKPPLMVAGMTPCTVQSGFVSAILKAGYHVELAGGGHYNAKALRSKVDQIQKEVNLPGMGITLNSLYINQRQWTFQLPLWQEMKKEGLPIEGLTVAAGIPSTEKAQEIIDGLRDAGIKHVSFKPGSVDGIRQVINIAAAHPDFPIILQWTGGRAGGHHSCEDFHSPILATYASIRARSNIVLVGGSGFGGAEDTYPYLSGVWSEKGYGVERMPFDGFLFGSRVMVAKEAHTSESVKQLIVDAKGVPDGNWEQTYDKPVGGIMTVTSELGEPIHKVATRGVKLWGEFDKTVFALPREKQAAWLEDHKQYVVDRLNADFQKPWFPAKADGTTCDLADMTYAEVNSRLVRLMYVAHEKRWVDPSLRTLLGDWIRRVEERLSNVNAGIVKVSSLQSYHELDEPKAFLEKFLVHYPAAAEQVLASADVAYFLAITQRPGQKPVPFIPVLDASFSIWFKKDSLWQADDIEAVFDQDPQRVCILMGPVAVKWAISTQQPIGEMLGEIESGLASRLLEEYYSNDESKIPTIAYLAPNPTKIDESLVADNHIAYSVESTTTGSKHIYAINGVLPPTGEWLETLGGPKLGWLQAFLTNVSITHGKQTLPNPVQRVLAPRHGQRVELSISSEGDAEKLEVFGN